MVEEMFEYQKTNRYFAQFAEGFEELVANELADLGARQIAPGFRGMHFCADRQTLYGINYRSRLASRVLAPLKRFDCRDREDLYREGKSIDWPAVFSITAVTPRVCCRARLMDSAMRARHSASDIFFRWLPG